MVVKLVRNYSLNDIKNSINYYLDVAKYDPKVREFALRIVNGNPDKISAIYDWIQQNVGYVGDPVDVELLTSPIRMIKDYQEGKLLAEDCDGMSILATALYRSIGIESTVILMDTSGQGINHSISSAKSEKLGWINVDPSDKTHPLGWEIPYTKKVVV